MHELENIDLINGISLIIIILKLLIDWYIVYKNNYESIFLFKIKSQNEAINWQYKCDVC